MNSEIMAFARGEACGSRAVVSNDCAGSGLSVVLASRLSRANNDANTTPPTPMALRFRNSRRV